MLPFEPATPPFLLLPRSNQTKRIGLCLDSKTTETFPKLPSQIEHQRKHNDPQRPDPQPEACAHVKTSRRASRSGRKNSKNEPTRPRRSPSSMLGSGRDGAVRESPVGVRVPRRARRCASGGRSRPPRARTCARPGGPRARRPGPSGRSRRRPAPLGPPSWPPWRPWRQPFILI